MVGLGDFEVFKKTSMYLLHASVVRVHITREKKQKKLFQIS